MSFNSAPLSTRGDIVMLGVIHRTVLGKGPRQYKEHFRCDQTGKLVDPRKTIGGKILKSSALGLVAIYNKLPQEIKRLEQVKIFRKEPQNIIKRRAERGWSDWKDIFSLRKIWTATF